MKKSVSIPVIILFAFILAITSCKKEESLDKLIIGKWKVQSITQIWMMSFSGKIIGLRYL